MADSARHEAAWDIDTGPPSWEEMKKAATMGKPGKAVNRAEIPSELWRNSESSLKVLWKLMRVMWVRMSEEMGDDQMPEDWVDATSVCLYKGKGSRQDPGMYRGISLISSMEKIFTTVILNRINIWVDKVISQQACGFRANKSCRDAVFSLWRRMERKWRAKEGFIITFIDFSKAFDSLVWDTLWRIMACLGCPKKMIAVVKSLYTQSTISIRLSKDGELAPKFVQKKGTRQGSGLSPCIFTMPVDFAIKVADLACEELGMVNEEDDRRIFADDIYEDKGGGDEEKASAALQEIEAAAAIGGLAMNPSKSEAMGCRIKAEVVSEVAANAVKERVRLGKESEGRRGWMAPAKWREELGIEKWTDEEAKGKMAIKMDDEEELLGEEKKGGWFKACDGKGGVTNYRLKKMAIERSLKAKKEKEGKKKRVTCERCGDEFPNEVSLSKHVERGWCKTEEEMTEKELSRRRVTRDTAAKKRGERTIKAEPVEVKSCNGQKVMPCGSFVYLGSLTNNKGESGPEIRRRIIKAGEVCRSLGKVWKMKGLSLKLKGRLFAAFVLSVLLYNSEVWVIGKREMEDLEGKVVYLMRKVVGEKVRKEKEGERMSNQQLREMLGIESVERMIRKRRLQWVAHSARRGQGDFTWKGMMREVEDEESAWGQQIRKDWKDLEVEGIDQWMKLMENKGWLSSTLRSSGGAGSEGEDTADG